MVDCGAVDTKPADDRVAETFTIVKSTRFAIVLGVRLTAVNGRYLQNWRKWSYKLEYWRGIKLRKIADTGDVGLFALATASTTCLNRKRPRQNHFCSSSSVHREKVRAQNYGLE